MKTKMNIEGVGEIQIEKTPETHAICEYCNEKVPFILMRKIGDVPCCIDCMHKMLDGASNLLDMNALYEAFVQNQ
jgi:formylmethanofuran dehydrogenase subunit E